MEAAPPTPATEATGGEGEGEGELAAPAQDGLPGPGEQLRIEPPAPPAPPDLGEPECPRGWTPEAQADPGWGPGPCVPPPDVVCEGATAQFAASPGCEQVGTACPEGERFGTVEEITGFGGAGGEGAPVIYVDVSAQGGGDGSRARPLRSIADAVARAERAGGSGIVALAPGTYRGPTVELRRASLVGACAQGVVLSPRGAGAAIVQIEPGVAVTVANVTLTGPERGIVVTGGSAPVTLASLVIEQVDKVGIAYNLGSPGGEVRDVVIRGVAAPDTLGLGLLAMDGSQVTGLRLQIESVQGAAVAAMAVGGVGGASLVVEDARISGPVDERGDDGSLGALAQGEVALTLRRTTISGPWRQGVKALADERADGWPRLDLDVIQVGPLRAVSEFAEGFILVGASGAIRRVGIRGVFGVGMAIVADPAGVLMVEDARIHDVAAADAVMGTALSAQAGRTEVRRLRVRGVQGLGVQVLGAGTFVDGQDWEIDEIDALILSRGAKPTAGDGIRVHFGGSASLTRLRIDGARSEGLVVGGEPGLPTSELELTDAQIVHTSVATGAFVAAGMSVYDGGVARLKRVAITDNEGLGFVCLNQKGLDFAVVEATDLLIARSSATRRVDAGAGLLIQGGCRFDGERVALVDNDLAGLWTDGGQTLDPPVGSLRDLVIRGTRSTPTDHRLGYGAIFAQGTQMELNRALIEGNRLAGLAAAGWGRSPETRVTAQTLIVRDTQPSACAELPPGDPLTCVSETGSGGVGAGVIGQFGARLTLTDFRITTSSFAGLVAGRGATVRASEGVITDNALGVAIWDEEYDVDGLFADVFNFDNEVDVAVRELSVPVPAAALADALGTD